MLNFNTFCSEFEFTHIFIISLNRQNWCRYILLYLCIIYSMCSLIFVICLKSQPKYFYLIDYFISWNIETEIPKLKCHKFLTQKPKQIENQPKNAIKWILSNVIENYRILHEKYLRKIFEQINVAKMTKYFVQNRKFSITKNMQNIKYFIEFSYLFTFITA